MYLKPEVLRIYIIKTVSFYLYTNKLFWNFFLNTTSKYNGGDGEGSFLKVLRHTKFNTKNAKWDMCTYGSHNIIVEISILH